MDDGSWQTPRTVAAGPDGGRDRGVRWRRRGRAVELRFDRPIGDAAWKQSGHGVESIPTWNAITAGGVAGGAVALGSVYAAPWVAAMLAAPALPAWVGLAVGAVAVPVAAGGGWLAGLRQREDARARRLATTGIVDALGEGFGIDLGGPGARALIERIVQAMRTGERQRAHVLSGRGHGRFRIEPSGEAQLLVAPIEAADDGTLLGRLGRAVAMPTSAQATVTAEAESRRLLLEQRLERVRAAGRIDARHASHPRLVTLQVDRMTEFRRLAARAEHLAGLPGEEARATVAKLVGDLDEVLELMRIGADELEQEVLEASVRDSDAHLAFLRDKYTEADDAHRRELDGG